MNSFDSTEANVNRSPASQEIPSSSSETSSGSAESSSNSGNTEKISTPPSIKPQKKSSPKSIRDNVTTPSKPSSSVKRPRELQRKEASKQSSKKSKKPSQEEEDNKGKTAGVAEGEKSLKNNGTPWNAKDEVAFLKRLVAFCEKGNGLPKKMGVFYEAVKNDLDGDYSNERLYNKVRGLKAKFLVARDKIKDKGFVGFKNSHEESLYRMSKKIWGNREEEEGYSENVGQRDNARGEKKKKNVVDNEGEREEVKRNKNGDVGMTLKEQEKEEEEEENEEEQQDEEEDENDNEEGEEHDQDEHLSQQVTMKEVKTMKRKENEPSDVAVTSTQRSKVRRGEKEVSSEEDVGEEQDPSDEDEESESESTDNENSALPDSNAAVEQSKYNIGGSTTARNLYSALNQTNGRENLTKHVSNGVSKGSRRMGTAGHYDAGENSRQHVVERLSDRRKVAAAGHHDAAENLARVPNGTANGSLGMTHPQQMFDQLCKENFRTFQDTVDGFKNDILNIFDTLKKDLQGSSNTARATGFDFSMNKGFPFGRELPPLSKQDAEMMDRKWEIQQFVEMEAAAKHLALLQEEYQLRMAKLRHQ